MDHLTVWNALRMSVPVLWRGGSQEVLGRPGTDRLRWSLEVAGSCGWRPSDCRSTCTWSTGRVFGMHCLTTICHEMFLFSGNTHPNWHWICKDYFM